MPERRLWEFQPFTICRILGLCYDENGLVKIFNDLKLVRGKDNNDHHFSSAFEMHGQLVSLCAEQGQVSKYMEKKLLKRFESYRERVRGLDREEIYKIIERGVAFKDVPLPALIWYAARRQKKDDGNHNNNDNSGEENDECIEMQIFSAIHRREHQALRFYDSLSRMIPDGKAEDVVTELRKALEANKKLQHQCKRLEKKREKLNCEIETIGKDKSELARALEEQRRLNERLSEKIEQLDKWYSLDRMEKMRREMEFLRAELKISREELQKRKRDQKQGREQKGVGENDTIHHSLSNDNDTKVGVGEEVEALFKLKGMRVAYVGGVESLMPHYKRMVESWGGVFCYHCGKCERGKREIEQIVDRNDVIFCPVDINSHSACQYVKQMCRAKDKRCYFLRSSGLATFKKELSDFACQIL